MELKEAVTEQIKDNGDGSKQLDIYVGGELKGTLVRWHTTPSEDKIGGDQPGLDPNIFVVDADGHLANG